MTTTETETKSERERERQHRAGRAAIAAQEHGHFNRTKPDTEEGESMQDEKRVAPAPTFDAHGYPTDETLDIIEKWPPQDVRGLLRFMAEAWKYSDRGPHPIDYLARITPHTGALNEEGYELWFATTGGWSGNEDLIRAFMRNAVAWSISWKASVAGGAYYWRVRKEQA